MQQSDLPTRFPIPFAASAGASYIRTVPKDPVTPTTTDAPASLTEGFPPECFQPEASGGIPPNGKDFNGILNQITAALRWLAAGGPAIFNSDFSTAIGGYPKGAILTSTASDGVLWQSTANNNTTDPDSGGAANWVRYSAGSGPYIVESTTTQNGGYRRWSDGIKETWGFVDVGANASATYTVPTAHTTWINATIGIGVQSGDDNNSENTGISSISTSAITIYSAENFSMRVFIQTRGV
jgi:hypothetical protein